MFIYIIQKNIFKFGNKLITHYFACKMTIITFGNSGFAH